MNRKMADNLLGKIENFVDSSENKALLLGEMEPDLVTDAHIRRSNIAMSIKDVFVEMLDLTQEQIDAVGVAAAMFYLSAMEDVHKCHDVPVDERTNHDVEHFASVLQDYLLAASDLTTREVEA